ncbi:MAG: acyl-ACP--UDP-N-acetylglucosamine O-acyltransferase [Candidatus Delongbacteria bacterium]|nr:acyl-ACP--UDP-N-acetylglucosamine O-acyltransferase [Candidatus Delongbacteria bacterium]
MPAQIHPTALIDSSACLGDSVQIGAYSVIGRDVRIGDGTIVKTHCVIDDYTEIGTECRIHSHATLGTPPQDLKYQGERTRLTIGNRTVIREYADLNRGTTATGLTSIGDDVLIMAYAHVAHDGHIGDRVIMANSVNLAGHVTVEHDVILGGMVPVHQFVKIGAYTIVGGGWRVSKDIPPFLTAAGEPLAYKGLNLIGLQRKGFSNERITRIRHLYRILYQSRLNVTDALKRIGDELDSRDPDIAYILNFIASCTRGIIGGFKRKTHSVSCD